jgi:hypothetical protein
MNRLLTGCLLLCLVNSAAAADLVALHGESSIHFATQAEAAKFLGKRDRFIAAMSPFDRHSRMRDETAKEADILELASSAALEWSYKDMDRMTQVIASAREKFKAFKIPFPKKIILIKSNGKEEGGAAYCRSNAIILPATRVATQPLDQLERLLIHELFHILSVHNPKLRTSLYKIIGFQTCDPIPLPKALVNRKITNPDAPLFDCFINLDHEGKEVLATPVLYASVEKYDAKKGGSFFKYLTFKLMVVEKVQDKYQAKVVDGEPIMLTPGKMESYFAKIGRNTGYIIHPDEVLADNFSYLILDKKNLKTPRVVDEMRKQLAK